jgi:hypothetical protein
MLVTGAEQVKNKSKICKIEVIFMAQQGSTCNLGTRTNKILGLQICNNQSVIKMALTNSLPKTIRIHRKRRVMERQRRTPENGVISTKSLGTTPRNAAQNSHWWLRSNTRS